MRAGLKLNNTPEMQRLLASRQKHHRAHPTPAEAHVMDLLESMGERFIFQKGFHTTNRFFIVDFYLPKRRKLCLEVDGAYHELFAAYDRKRDAFLTACRGFRVIRITNEHALNLTADQLRALIA